MSDQTVMGEPNTRVVLEAATDDDYEWCDVEMVRKPRALNVPGLLFVAVAAFTLGMFVGSVL